MRREVSLILFFILLLGSVSALSITEFESNPSGDDSGNEWIELYSNSEINGDYILRNADGDELNLKLNFSDYFIFTFEKQWLDNSDEKVFLYSGGDLILETPLFDDSENNDRTWQLCGGWEFIQGTRGEQNSCREDPNNEEETNPENSENDNENQEKPEETEGETSQEEDDKKSEEKTNEEPEEKIIHLTENKSPPISENSAEPIVRETISLGKDIKTEENSQNGSKENRWIIYLISFCFLITLLYITRGKKYGKNEFR